MPEKNVKVKVLSNYRVSHDGKPHVGGQTATVPEHVAQEWERAGFVELVKGRDNG